MAKNFPNEEQANELWIAIPDATYGQGNIDEEQASHVFRQELEAEYGREFRPANIGSGADWPAYISDLTGLIADEWWKAAGIYLLHEVILKGEQVEKSILAWKRMAEGIARFGARYGIVGTNGAKLLALNSICERLSTLPNSIELLGYRTFDHRFSDETPESFPPLTEIAPNIREELLGQTTHVFDFLVDGNVKLRAIVRGTDCSVLGG